MTTGKISVGDVKTELKPRVIDDSTGSAVIVNLANFDTFTITFLRPDGTTFSKTNADGVAIFNPPGADGVLHYITGTPSIWDQKGLWGFRVTVNNSVSGANFTSEYEYKEVLGN